VGRFKEELSGEDISASWRAYLEECIEKIESCMDDMIEEDEVEAMLEGYTLEEAKSEKFGRKG